MTTFLQSTSSASTGALVLPSLVPSTTPARMKIGSVLLHINPQHVEEQQPRQVYYQPGMAGSIRNDFGNGPHSWTISGHTGQGGLPALQQLQTLMTPAGQQAKPVSFVFPWMFGAKVFKVFVDDCSWTEQMNDGGYLFNYQILLRESIPQSSQPPILKVSGFTQATPLTLRVQAT